MQQISCLLFACFRLLGVTISNRILELERELDEQLTLLAKVDAHVASLRFEIERLRATTADASSLGKTPLTEGILIVLRTARTTLSPTQIQERLSNAGKVVALNKVTATLSHLKKSKRVVLEKHGQYLAT